MRSIALRLLLTHCPDLDCWNAFLQHRDVLIAPVITSYPRGIVKPWLQSSFLFDVLVAPLGLCQDLTELIHLAMKIIVSHPVITSCASIVINQEPDCRFRSLRDPRWPWYLFTSWNPLSALPFACGSYDAGWFSWIAGYVLALMTLLYLRTNAGSPSVFSVLRVADAPHHIVHHSVISQSFALTSNRIHACSCPLVPPTTSPLQLNSSPSIL